MHPGVARQLAGQRRFFLPWLGAALAALVLAGLGSALAGEAVPSQAALPPPARALTAAGFVWGGILLLLRQRVLAPNRVAARLPAPDAELVVRHLLAGHLVLWSAAVVPAILGIAQILAGGDARTHLLLCAASIWILAYLMPARARLAARAEAVIAEWGRASRS